MRLLTWMALLAVTGVLAACSQAATAPPPTKAPADAPFAKPTFIFLWRTG